MNKMKRQLLVMASCLAMAMGLRVMPAMAQEQPEECFPQGTVWEEEKVDVFPVDGTTMDYTSEAPWRGR